MKPRHVIPAILLAMLVAYPLSLGPVMRMEAVEARKSGNDAIGYPLFYLPLEYARRNSRTLDKVMARYENMWVDGVYSN